MNKQHDSDDACTSDCAFCGEIYPSETLTRVVLAANDEAPERDAAVCASCLPAAIAQGATALPRERLDLGVLGRAFEGLVLSVERASSEYGTPRPTIRLRASTRSAWRRIAAASHTIAALIEMETPGGEGWLPTIGESGRVYLELTHGSEAEAERAMALLRGLVERIAPGGR